MLLDSVDEVALGGLHGLVVSLLSAGVGLFKDEFRDSRGKAAWGDMAVDRDGGSAEVEGNLNGGVDVVGVSPDNAAIVYMREQGGAGDSIVSTRGWAFGIGCAASWSTGGVSPPMADGSDIGPAFI